MVPCFLFGINAKGEVLYQLPIDQALKCFSMRPCLILFFLVGYSMVQVKAQILNGGFEMWEWKGSWEEPVHWHSNNAEGFVSVFSSSDAFEGERAVRLRSNGLSFEGYAPGTLDHTFTAPEWPARITARVKCDTLVAPARAVIELFAWKNGLTYFLNGWETDEVNTDYQWVEIPVILPGTIDSLTIRLMAATEAGPLGFEGYASFLVDEVQGEGTTTIAGQLSTGAINRVSPNPFTSTVMVEFDQYGEHQVSVFTPAGFLVKKSRLHRKKESLSLNELPAGLYYLQLDQDRKLIPVVKL